MKKSSIQNLLQIWSKEPSIQNNIVVWHEEPEAIAEFSDFPADIFIPIIDYLSEKKGVSQLFSHQAMAWEEAKCGHNFVVVSGTASGKTLCYNLPVLNYALRNSESRALYLFPTKALTQDQYQNLIDFVSWPGLGSGKSAIPVAVYDGDTPVKDRSGIRSKARIILSNPDMLHTGILPYHTRWEEFFRYLKFVIIDEIHVYRGVFGSHIANLMRRLKRIAAHYGSHPQFFLTSATIGNPGELAERLIEEPVKVIEKDGSPHGKRQFLFYNPPIVDPNLGIRAGSLHESIRLTSDLLDLNIQTLLFARARKTVEIMLMYLQQARKDNTSDIRAYRSGYLARERREIEQSLRVGTARAVVATNALELGIDIGQMDAVILIGYPGTIASTRQQAGRAGRKHGESLAVLVASANPLDQYLMNHPEFIFERSPEHALINPDNLLILLQHLRCAAFELPFNEKSVYGNLSQDLLHSLLDFLIQSGEIHRSEEKYFWMSDQYPYRTVSLRNSSPRQVLLELPGNHGERTIGQVDYESALWMVHPGAIYLQAGKMYEVKDLNLVNDTATLTQIEVDIFTEPKRSVNIEKVSVLKNYETPAWSKYYGEIIVTTKVTGFRKLRWYSNEILAEEELDLPSTQLHTTGYWISIESWTIDQMREKGQWTGDANYYGPSWNFTRNLVLQRDNFTCQSCGSKEGMQSFHVHHKIPFRLFPSLEQANQLSNLVTLCPSCHHKAELSILIRSGLAGLSYVIQNLSPLFVMCDISDIGAYYDPLSNLVEKKPAIILYDMIPAGIGLSEALYDRHNDLLYRSLELINECHCQNGCPSCVGPSGSDGVGGKAETQVLLSILCSTII